MSYHAVWDWGVLDRAHGWSYSEYREQLDTHTKRERRAIAAGTPREWVHETAVDCRVIYDWQRPDEVYDNDFVQDTYLLAERQLVKAAYRLAALAQRTLRVAEPREYSKKSGRFPSGFFSCVTAAGCGPFYRSTDGR